MDILIKNLTKIFTDKDKSVVRAVDDLTLLIPSGKLIGLLGPSGCGKSTTLYLLAGLLAPTSGEIFFGDDEITTLPPNKRGIGLVFQNYALYPHMTVFQNIKFPLENLGIPRPEMLDRVQQVAQLVDIAHLLNRKPRQLSGGQQQRVAIARALVKYPKVLLLDEPLSNLDARLRLQTREEIKRIQRETLITTVFVTHDQEEAMSISDTIVVMKDGISQQVGVPQDVYNYPINKFVAKFLGTPPINMFVGEVKNGYVVIGNERIQKTDFPNQEVFVGIRPEGFVFDPNGALTVFVESIEYIGRDKSIIAKHPNAETPTIRLIIDQDVQGIEEGKYIKLNIKEQKIHLFSRVDEYNLKYTSQNALRNDNHGS